MSAERRKAKRILVRESFSFFMVIPKKLGMARVYLKDISSGGLSFWADDTKDFPKGSGFEARLYSGPGFFIPIEATVIRSQNQDIAVEFTNKNGKAAQALSKYLDFLDAAAEAAVFDSAQK